MQRLEAIRRWRREVNMHAWFLVLILVAVPAQGKDVPAALSAEAAFEKLKKLAGDWEETTKKGGPLRVHYKVTPDGSAIIETFDPGTAREMINVYQMDGSHQLFLTHYCALGNQPRMRFEKSSLPDEVRFSFAGGNNLNPEKDRHLRWEVIRFLGDQSIESKYAFYQNGQRLSSHSLTLRRRK